MWYDLLRRNSTVSSDAAVLFHPTQRYDFADVIIIDIIQHSINEIEYYISIEDTSYSTRSTKQTFVCNLGAGMIGGVAGFLAGALTGSVTGPGGSIVGSIVSTTVSAYISTKAC